MTLSSSSFDSTTGILTMNFCDELENGMVAGKPYIVKWTTGDDLVNPVFTGVTISDATANVSTDYVDFIGTYSPQTIYESTDAKHNLYLGDDNKLYWPTATDFKVNACRGWFKLKGGLACGEPAPDDPEHGGQGVRAFNLNFGGKESQGISDATRLNNNEERINNKWYTLDGVRLDAQPTKKGLYIHGGKKVVVP
jgi:hypothetical protein